MSTTTSETNQIKQQPEKKLSLAVHQGKSIVVGHLFYGLKHTQPLIFTDLPYYLTYQKKYRLHLFSHHVLQTRTRFELNPFPSLCICSSSGCDSICPTSVLFPLWRLIPLENFLLRITLKNISFCIKSYVLSRSKTTPTHPHICQRFFTLCSIEKEICCRRALYIHTSPT